MHEKGVVHLACCTSGEPLLVYKKPHQRDVMKLRLNTGFEGATRFVILWLLSTTWVEARHCGQRFARHFIKNLKSIPINFDVDIFSMIAVLIDWHKGTSNLPPMQELALYLTLHFFSSSQFNGLLIFNNYLFYCDLR